MNYILTTFSVKFSLCQVTNFTGHCLLFRAKNDLFASLHKTLLHLHWQLFGYYLASFFPAIYCPLLTLRDWIIV
jgi:hypothetical protein